MAAAVVCIVAMVLAAGWVLVVTRRPRVRRVPWTRDSGTGRHSPRAVAARQVAG